MPTQTPPAVELLTPAEAIEHLGRRGLRTTDRTLGRWADRGLIRHVRLPSGHRRYQRADLDAFLVAVEPGSAA